ncbi:MAG: 4Fe-4S dicluster domain-containing protein [Anaerosomatales bacterium]|nr:4Fe-4S dicluster domain-containing protein [Anaerosomatales bacterium]
MADIDKNATDVAANSGSGVSRREFLTGVGGAGVGLVLGGALIKGFFLPDEVFAVPASGGYLLVDTKKCAGCASCMLACSLAHSGECNLSLSRIQVLSDPFGPFGETESLVQEQCRQCTYPACVDACPTGAMHADEKTGVRMVDPAKCIGCERCVNACPFTPSRVQWNPAEKHAQKCDLCIDTPYMTEDGGPGGQQACVAVCPTKAITFVEEIPMQSDAGYQVNLREGMSAWATLALPQGDDGEYTGAAGANNPLAGH